MTEMLSQEILDRVKWLCGVKSKSNWVWFSCSLIGNLHGNEEAGLKIMTSDYQM